MALLPHIFSVALALCCLEQTDLPVHVLDAQPPAHPVNTLATGLVVVEVGINRITGNVQTQMLYGEPPFAAAALEALERWRFVVPPEADIGTTSVTFLFRTHTIYSVKIGATTIRPWNPPERVPALPQEIIDPGYPVTSLVTGAVILEAQVNASGVVTSAKPIHGVAPLTDVAQKALKDWRFSPATISGKALPSTVFVVVSFVLPT